ncbi:FAD-binding oxidoreductase [Candidatus Nitrotoga sp. HW29]|uniref:FAD-binding oxidoreductase n=1 Tax=Candidatus Nitrotoga sp. HW29 TaxID=2886963 RepID=UPI001EF1BA71|nr:FAD-binding oxidoreductase [Candidatus Nitrotoga sp. HW29]CAH1905346.1 FAD-binding oxidoreductase [Candidatus Nitrotoga sp. HW29]
MENLINRTRRKLLQLIALSGVASSGLFHASVALAKSQGHTPTALENFKGPLIARANKAYLDWFWAMSWYRVKPIRYPSIIAQPKDKDDLALLLAYAKKVNKPVTFRSSGHNISSAFLQDDVITVDMSQFTELKIDVKNKIAWAGPGLLSEHLNKAAYDHGLAFPSAHTGFVTIGGFLLGGGLGWNMPARGLGSASIISAEVMLANGKVLTISKHENEDLFWAMRGAGSGFFAGVLRYKLQLYDTPSIVKNVYAFPLEKIENASQEILRLLPESNYRTELTCVMGNFPPSGGDKDGWYWTVIFISFGDSIAAAKKAAAVFKNSKLPELSVMRVDHDEVLDYMQLYEQLSTDSYAQYRTAEMAIFTDKPTEVIKIVGKHIKEKAVDRRSFSICVPDGNPTMPEPCCYTYTAPHYVSWYLIGKNDDDVKANYKLLDEIHADVKPYIRGYYMNETDFTHNPELAPKLFSGEKWRKLLEVRQKYDPDKRFMSYLDKNY